MHNKSQLTKLTIFLGVLLLLCVSFAYGQTEEKSAPDLEELVISSSRFYQTPFEASSSIDLINRANIQDYQQQINISESLSRVPGVTALNRQNYAQDTMLSIRGFGANSAFGARGIKVYVDGIPATMPDGQSQLSHIDLSSVDRIEVLRGPFSVLYGNSAGGVVNIYSEKGAPGVAITPYSSYGSFNTSKLGIKVSGDEGDINYLLDMNQLNSNGSRTHSEASRDNENAKITIGGGRDTQISFIGNRVNLNANDPLGLTASQIITSPQGAGTNAEAWNTRKTVTQLQGGVELLHKINQDSGVKFMVYSGTRNQFQFQAPSSSTIPFVNGAISLDRAYLGFDGQYQLKTIVNQVPLKMTVGMNYGNDNDHSMGYCNSYGELVNCTGKKTSINTDAKYQANNLDQYLQIEFDPYEKINVTLGLRNTSTQLNASDNLNTWAYASKSYNQVLPMASASYLINTYNRLYTSVGIGYDTPTLNQIKYSCATNACAATSSNPNMLDAATTTQYEIGWKSIIPEIGNFNAALFVAKSNNEIVALNNISGKTIYQNANKTSRSGFELFAHIDLPRNWYTNMSYTYTLAQVTQDYASAGGVNIASGSSIPGVSAHRLFNEIAWQLPDHSMNIGAEFIAASNMYASDVNSTNSNASGYVISNVRIFARQQYERWKFTELARINNIFDTYYIGSVIVNQASSQYFEPSPGRNWFVGINASLQF
jgi:iron complex outermembrane receptor protein